MIVLKVLLVSCQKAEESRLGVDFSFDDANLLVEYLLVEGVGGAIRVFVEGK